ncbi:helix-turn-helix transcriptional regulator [Agromyces mariniharenae]|uniref:Helix-turn-helix transcriptional regulator n=1 Tax=Agromyces mariniharenae TaxID=2604423 RepID=A0A5S4UVS9_9MICO|nr:AraC family transcriptional regulator [Agromyces mariniharenae]TYL50288.1 helix-turn-helix transcriptional regulator [Agromyces mariniharenae]
MTAEVVHWHWETRDPGVADQVVRDTYPGSELKQLSSFGRFTQELDGDAGVNEVRMRLDGSFEGASDMEGEVLVVLPTAGEFAWTVGEECGSGNQPFLGQPGDRIRSRQSDAELRLMSFDAAAMAGYAADAYGMPDADVRFDGPDPVSPELERFWVATAAMAAAVFRDPALDTMPIVHATTRRHLAMVTLEAFRLVGDPDVRLASFRARQRLSRRALAYVEDHAHEPITPDDVARAVGVPTTALDELLRATTGSTAADLLRRARLAGAHAELTRSDAATTTVAAVARTWGYRDPAAFARQYGAVHGRPPSHTLRS